MDLTRAVTYRGFPLNGPLEWNDRGDFFGCEITSVSLGSVLGVGYDEKRALDEGRDAGDVYLDQRLISMAGNVYGRTRAEAFDHFRQFTNVMTPSDAYQADPSHRGYLPMDFWTPTLLTKPEPVEFGSSGLIHQMLQVRPLATPSALFGSDRHGGVDVDALAIPWSAQLAAKDPRITSVQATSTPLRGAMSNAGDVRNRGNRPAVVDIYLTVPPNANGSAPQSKVFLKINECMSLTIHIPTSDKQCVVRYSTDQKTLGYAPAGQALKLRMDLLEWHGSTTHKHLPTGKHGFKWVVTGTKQLQYPSYFAFRDTWV